MTERRRRMWLTLLLAIGILLRHRRNDADDDDGLLGKLDGVLLAIGQQRSTVWIGLHDAESCELFEVVGADDPRVATARRALARALF